MKRKIGFALILIGVLLVASIAFFYITEASVNYLFKPYVYQKIGDNWFTSTDYYNQSNPLINGTFARIECQNKGLFDATFNIVIKLTNATFSEKSLLPSQFEDSNTVKIPYSLHSQERTHTDVNFTVNSDAVGFVISMQFESSQILMRHTVMNWGGQSEFPYGHLTNDTWAPAQIS